MAELILKHTRRDLGRSAPELVDKIKSYRSGYTIEDRRALEQALFRGELLGTTATSALELGVDIGSLDATVLLGFPGSIASMWQRAGRSGRGTNAALTILVLFNSPLDQYYGRHPRQLFDRRPEAAVCDPTNPYVLREHLLCASQELPVKLAPKDDPRPREARDALRDVAASRDAAEAAAAAAHPAIAPAMIEELRDDLLFGDSARELLGHLAADGLTLVLPQGHVLAQLDGRPSRSVSLRTVEQEGIRILKVPEMVEIDEVDLQHAIWEVYEGAIFLHQGDTYLIERLDLTGRTAHAKLVTVDYFTRSRDAKDVDVTRRIEAAPDEIGAGWGDVVVRQVLYGYYKFRERTLHLFETVEFFMPPVEYGTRGFWVEIPPETKRRLEAEGRDFLAGMHGATHAIKSAVPLHILCDPGDIDCEHIAPLQERPR